MNDQQFAYVVVLSDDETTAVSLIAYKEQPTDKLRAVIWNVRRRRWIYAPAIAAQILYDDLDATSSRSVDCVAAERAAKEYLSTALPSEQELIALCVEGEQRGWRYGPPPSGDEE